MRSPLALIVAVGLGCAAESGASGREVPAEPLDVRPAEEVLYEVERDLLNTDQRRLAFEVRSEGEFSAALDGHLILGEGNAVRLEGSGVFGRDSVSLWLDAMGDRMTWGNGEETLEAARPGGLRDGVVVGLVRMGVLHNLARLVSGAPPDRADGTVRSWVEVEDVAWDDEPQVGAYGISFGIRVEGRRAGTATLWLGPEGEIVGREQVVSFPSGEMRVVERYQMAAGSRDYGVGVVSFAFAPAPGVDLPESDELVVRRTASAASDGVARFLFRGAEPFRWSYELVIDEEGVEGDALEFGYEVLGLPFDSLSPGGEWARVLYGRTRQGAARRGWVRLEDGQTEPRLWAERGCRSIWSPRGPGANPPSIIGWSRWRWRGGG